eukprot:184637_1
MKAMESQIALATTSPNNTDDVTQSEQLTDDDMKHHTSNNDIEQQQDINKMAPIEEVELDTTIFNLVFIREFSDKKQTPCEKWKWRCLVMIILLVQTSSLIALSHGFMIQRVLHTIEAVVWSCDAMKSIKNMQCIYVLLSHALFVLYMCARIYIY